MNVNWLDLLRALALVAIIEGILPVLAPARYRELLLLGSSLPPEQLRGIGIGAMLLGLLMLYLLP